MTDDRRYASTFCPYCSAALDPVPRAKKRCPYCGGAIWVRSGPDGLTYLLRDVDRATLDEAWAEHWSAEEARETAELNRRAAEQTAATLRDYRAAGVREVERS